ncbi:Integrase catalytic domain-containing protein [Dermacoccus abyssi]
MPVLGDGGGASRTVIDDHSRVAYTEVHDDETAVTAVAVLRRAVQWFAGHGVTIERVLSDNGGAYRSHLWRDTCDALSITPKRTRPYRPQTNGKVERFHRTMADGWAYARCYTSEQERRDALEPWLGHYNEVRPHTACDNQPPLTKLRAAGYSSAASTPTPAGSSVKNSGSE